MKTYNELQIQRDLWMSEISLINSRKEVEDNVMKKLGENPGWDEPFFVANLDLVVDKYNLWKNQLPNVDIFYAVKANDDPMHLKLLVALGASFDCASKGEIENIMSLGVPLDRIMFSNPYKLPSHLSFATLAGVRWMVCDSLCELNKIHSMCPLAKLVIRINPRKETTAYPTMSTKFGCNFEEAKKLLVEAKKMGLSVEGISFYVGHCTQSPAPYADAIQLAKEVFLKALTIGHNIQLVDIGGGFQGPEEKKDLFVQVAATIRESLSKHFPPELGVRVIGEPGQFMGIQAFDIFAKVIGVRLRQSAEGELVQYVVVSGGHFGCINNVTFKYNRTKIVVPKADDAEDTYLVKSIFWGPSCDPMDILLSIDFPPLKRGMWLKFTNLGAYTRSLMTTYNGFPLAPTKYFMNETTKDILETHFI